MDYYKKTIPMLKELVKTRGLDARGLTKKSEFVELLKLHEIPTLDDAPRNASFCSKKNPLGLAVIIPEYKPSQWISESISTDDEPLISAYTAYKMTGLYYEMTALDIAEIQQIKYEYYNNRTCMYDYCKLFDYCFGEWRPFSDYA